MAYKPEEHISRFVSGELVGTDLRRFETALTEDEGLREAVALQQKIETELSDRATIDALLAQAEQDHTAPAPSSASSRRLPRWLVAAAAILLIGVIGTFIWSANQDNHQLLAKKYLAYNLPESHLPSDYLTTNNRLGDSGSTKGSEESKLPLLSVADTARKLLYDRRYDTSLVAYLRIPTSALTDKLRFERAVLLLKSEQPTLALKDLSQIQTDFQGGKIWYTALAYLQTGDKEKAKAQLLLLVDTANSSPYRLEVEELLGEL